MARGALEEAAGHDEHHRGRWMWWLGAVVICGLAVRVMWGAWQPTDEALLAQLPDQQGYLELGRTLLGEGRMKWHDARFGQDTYAVRTPGYPIFIAACGGKVVVVRLAQAVMDALTALAAFLLARRWCAIGASLMAAALVAFNPFLIYFSGLILSETLFTALLAWGMVLLSRRSLLLGGIVLALGVLVRPSAIALPVVLGFVEVFAAGEEKNRRWVRAAAAGVGMAALVFVALFPWAMRNYRVLGVWVITTNSGFVAYDGFHDGATGASDQSFLEEMPELRALSEVERNERLGREARRWVLEHPVQAIKLAFVKLGRTWSPVPLSAEYQTALHLSVGLLYSLPLFGLVLAGLWLWPAPRAVKVYLLAPAVYFSLVHMLSVGSLRYRVPAEAPMACIAAEALHRLIDGLRARWWRGEAENEQAHG